MFLDLYKTGLIFEGILGYLIETWGAYQYSEEQGLQDLSGIVRICMCES